MMLIKRGDIFYADLDPIIGSEQGGIRPVIVVQNNVGNKIRTIDRNRLLRYVGSVGLEIMEKVDKAVKISIGVNVND